MSRSGTGKKGVFAVQWKQDDGNVDGVIGGVENTEVGMRLAIQEYEDGEQPGEDHGVPILEREKKTPKRAPRD